MNFRNFFNVVIYIASASSSTVNVASNCKSRLLDGKIYVDCARLNLTDKHVPRFNDSVIGVDLGFDLLSDFPPNLPKRIVYINVTGNMISYLNGKAMRRYRSLSHLTISYCLLRQIDLGTFQKNKMLQHLDVSNNEKLSISVLTNLSSDLRFSSIKVLNLEKLSCTFGLGVIFKTQYVRDLQNTKLENLNIASNRIKYFDDGVMKTLPTTLKYFNFADNILSYGTYLFQFGYLTSLEVLNASHGSWFHEVKDFFYHCNEFTKTGISGKQQKPIKTTYQSYKYRKTFFKSTETYYIKRNLSKKTAHSIFANYSSKRQNKESVLPRDHLKTKDDDHVANNLNLNDISKRHFSHSFRRQNIPPSVMKIKKFNITFYIPPNLKKVYFENNLFSLSIPEVHINASTITHIYAQNSIMSEMSGPFYGVKSVTYVNFSNNFCSKLSSDFFVDAVNLLHLDLSNNVLGTNIANDIEGNIFRNQKSLQTLNLSNNMLFDLPFNIFRNLKNLEHLNLSNNKLDRFNIRIDHMHKLLNVDLSLNQISIFDHASTNNFNSLRRNISINLYGNSLLCSCQTLYFLEWMNKSPNITFVNLKKYKCSFPNGTTTVLENLPIFLKQLEKECASYTTLIVIMTSVFIISMTTIVCGVLYRYRWKLRYLYYVAKRQYRGYSVLGEEQVDYKYDAFISYADEDKSFIIDHVDFLEKDNELKLCIHSRDFIPGTPIADNATNAIHNSRHTVCIMTSHYLRSYWCMFELNIARMEAVYSRNGDNVILLILLEKADIIKEMPLVVLDLIESDSYLEYPQEASHIAFFWTRLIESLREH